MLRSADGTLFDSVPTKRPSQSRDLYRLLRTLRSDNSYKRTNQPGPTPQSSQKGFFLRTLRDGQKGFFLRTLRGGQKGFFLRTLRGDSQKGFFLRTLREYPSLLDMDEVIAALGPSYPYPTIIGAPHSGISFPNSNDDSAESELIDSAIRRLIIENNGAAGDIVNYD